MPDILSASIAFPLLNFAFKTVQTGYELAGVTSETSDHLNTIKQVLLDIRIAKNLRIQKAAYLTDDEIVIVDTVIRNTELSLAKLESLVERARVDMGLRGNTVGAQARIMWVMRDSEKAKAAMERLALTSQSLHSQTSMMRQAACSPDQESPVRPSLRRVTSPPYSDYGVSTPSHLLETSKYIAERRDWVKRRYSVKTEPSTPSESRHRAPYSSSTREDTTYLQNALQNVARWIDDNESVLSDMDPDSYAVSTDSMLTARIIDVYDQYPQGHAESPSEPYTIPHRTQRQTSTSMPNSPYLSSSTHTTGNHPPRRQFEPPIVPHIMRTAPAQPSQLVPGSINLSRPASGPRATSTAMSMTTVTPGRRSERQITWQEPTHEEDQRPQVSRPTTIQESVNEHPPPYSPGTPPRVSQLNRTAASNAAGLQGRRAPRNHNVQHVNHAVTPQNHPNIQLTAPLIDDTGSSVRSGPVRSHRSRPSRSQWALEQHESEVASISSRRSSQERQ